MRAPTVAPGRRKLENGDGPFTDTPPGAGGKKGKKNFQSKGEKVKNLKGDQEENKEIKRKTKGSGGNAEKKPRGRR